MNYLFIKKNDVKVFKNFLSGKEIEVGVVLESKVDLFGTGDEIEVFYGNNSIDPYRAKITRHKRSFNNSQDQRSLVMLGLVKR